MTSVDPGPEPGADADADVDAECDAGEVRRCGTSDIGVCEYGQQRCVSGRWAVCEGATEPTAETCDGEDQDCDGVDDADDPDTATCDEDGGGDATCRTPAELGLTVCVTRADCGDEWQSCCDDDPCSAGQDCAEIDDCEICGQGEWGCGCYVCYWSG
jgi:hypothetical protein